jgi:glycosyltransferase involved in cell wall biosynthesis
MRDLLHAKLGYPMNRIDVVPLLERGDGGLSREVSEQGNEVLFFGRIWEYKGLSYFIEASDRIIGILPNLRFVIAGRGESLQKYRSQIKSPAHFEIHEGYVDDEFAAALFRRSSLVVLPYTEATQSGVIPVAYTYGRPVVATRVGGIPFQVDDGVTGLLVPPRDSVALADAIITLMSDPDRRSRMGAAGARKAATEWSAEVVAQQTIGVYERVLGQSSSNGDSKL